MMTTVNEVNKDKRKEPDEFIFLWCFACLLHCRTGRVNWFTVDVDNNNDNDNDDDNDKDNDNYNMRPVLLCDTVYIDSFTYCNTVVLNGDTVNKQPNIVNIT